ncbi:MAG: hypothetical protein HLX45_11620 [Bacillus sp. (in: Bacteria)]|nr:hypothetical protein [Bacillus sp. (in: firmicutes)]
MNLKFQQQINEKSIEQRKKQKELIKKKLLKHEGLLKQKQVTPSPQSNFDEQREEILRKKKKEYKLLHKKLKQKKQDNNELKLKLNKAETEIFQLKEKNWQLKQQMIELQKTNQELQKQYDKLISDQESKVQPEYESKNLDKGTKQDQKIAKKLLKLSNQVKKLKESNYTLRQKLNNYDAITEEQYGTLKQELVKLQREVQKYKNMERQLHKNPMTIMKYICQNMSDENIPEILNLLEGYISAENLDYFFRGQNNVFYLMMRRVDLIKHQLEKRNEQYHLGKTIHSNQWERLGYLDRTENGCFFVDLTEEDDIQRFEVKNIECGEEVQSDQPVKARVQEEYAIITECYPIEYPEPVKKPPLSVKVKQKVKDYLYLGPFRVLVIGARFLNEYKDRLEKHGCIVEIHNPYEESYELLKGKISRAEIILVCERHVAHSVWDYVDKSQPYVSVLKKDSRDLISTYTYLTLKRCELN